MYVETWAKLFCPSCSKVNWLCLGNLEDQTAPDREACECWSCGAVFALSDDGSEEAAGRESVYPYKGRKMPR